MQAEIYNTKSTKSLLFYCIFGRFRSKKANKKRNGLVVGTVFSLFQLNIVAYYMYLAIMLGLRIRKNNKTCQTMNSGGHSLINYLKKICKKVKKLKF